MTRVHRAADVTRIVVLVVSEARGGVDFSECAKEAKLLAVFLVLPHPAILAANANIHFAHRHVPAWVAEPFRKEFGLCVRVVDELARGVELARDANFSIARQRDLSWCWHFPLSFHAA